MSNLRAQGDAVHLLIKCSEQCCSVIANLVLNRLPFVCYLSVVNNKVKKTKSNILHKLNIRTPAWRLAARAVAGVRTIRTAVTNFRF